MPVTEDQILELREAYREARVAIEQITDAVEREIGLASHRLEATETYKRLVVAGRGVEDRALQPLNVYVASLSGGENAERAVAWLDAKAREGAKKARSMLWAQLSGTAAVAAGSGVAAAVAFWDLFVGSAEAFGAALIIIVTTGGWAALHALRILSNAPAAAEELWANTWARAERTGVAADAALSNARRLALPLWVSTGVLQPPTPFTAKARARVRGLVAAAWLLGAVAVVLVAIGAYRQARTWWHHTKVHYGPPTITFQPSTPAFTVSTPTFTLPSQ
jgi:hypothetical protein